MGHANYGFRLWNKAVQSIEIGRNVIFDESIIVKGGVESIGSSNLKSGQDLITCSESRLLTPGEQQQEEGEDQVERLPEENLSEDSRNDRTLIKDEREDLDSQEESIEKSEYESTYESQADEIYDNYEEQQLL